MTCKDCDTRSASEKLVENFVIATILYLSFVAYWIYQSIREEMPDVLSNHPRVAPGHYHGAGFYMSAPAHKTAHGSRDIKCETGEPNNTGNSGETLAGSEPEESA